MANPFPANFEGLDGSRRLTGQVNFTDPANQPGGSASAAGSMLTADYLFTERATAGVYSASFSVTAGMTVANVLVFGLVAPWACDTAELVVEDSLHATSWMDVDLVSGIDATYTTNGTNYRSKWTDTRGDGGFYGGASMFDIQPAAAVQMGPGARYAASNTITLTVTSTIAVPPVVPVGSTLVRIIYFAPITAVVASFA